MAELKIKSASDLEQVATDLRNANQQLSSTTDAIKNQVNMITTKWTGEASDKFRERFNRDSKNFTTFMDAIEQYAGAIDTIVQDYQNTEQANIDQASNGH